MKPLDALDWFMVVAGTVCGLALLVLVVSIAGDVVRHRRLERMAVAQRRRAAAEKDLREFREMRAGLEAKKGKAE